MDSSNSGTPIVVEIVQRRVPKAPNIFPPPWGSSSGFELLDPNPLGVGSFGTVWKAHHRVDRLTYAIKRININTAFSQLNPNTGQSSFEGGPTIFPKLQREVDHHSSVTSSFVVKYHSHWMEGPESYDQKITDVTTLFGAIHVPSSGSLMGDDSCHADSGNPDDTFLYIQMEFCNMTTLSKFLIQNNAGTKLSEELPRIVNQTAKGLAAIHGQGIIHRDLKPDNIFCTTIAGRERLVWKIGDFGLSLKNVMSNEFSNRQGEGTSTTEAPSIAGTLIYQSPEMYRQLKYTNKTDIYSLGLIYVEVLCMFPTVKERRLLFLKLKDGREEPSAVSRIPTNIPCCTRYLDIIKRMLDVSPDSRPEASTVHLDTLQPIHFYKATDKLAEFNCIGRETEVDWLNQNTLSGKQVSIITGTYGIGKTALVKKFITSGNRSSWIWLNASSKDTLEAELFNLSIELDIPTRKDGKVGYIREIEDIFLNVCKSLQTMYSQRIVFVIFDDICEEYDISNMVEQLNTNGVFCILLTRELSNVKINYDSDSVLQLGAMNANSTSYFLQTLLSGNVSSCSGIELLCSVLRGHPTAIEDASKVITDRHRLQPALGVFGVNLYCKQIHTFMFRQMKVFECSNSKRVAYACGAATIVHLVRFYKPTLDVLTFLYYVFPHRVSVAEDKLLFYYYQRQNHDCTHEHMQSQLRVLKHFNVINEDYLTQFISLTDWADDVLPTALSEYNDLHNLLEVLEKAFPISRNEVPLVLSVWERVLPFRNLVTRFANVIIFCQEAVSETHNVLHGLAAFNRKTYRSFKTFLGPLHETTLKMGEWYATTLVDGGQFANALKVYSALLRRCEKHLGSNHRVTVRLAVSKGSVLLDLGRHKEAKSCVERGLLVQQQMYGDDQREIIKGQTILATLHNAMHQFDQALTILRETLVASETLLGKDSDVTATTMTHVASTLYEKEEYGEAFEMFKEAFQTEVRIYGEEHPTTLLTKLWLARTLRQVEEPQVDRQVEIYEHILVAQERALGGNHPDIIGTKEEMATFLYDQGNLQKAKEMFNKVLDMRLKLFGLEHPSTLNAKHALADIYADLEDWAESLKTHEEILPVKMKVLGKMHPATLECNLAIGTALYRLEQFERSSSVLKNVVQLKTELLGADHQDTLEARYNYAQALCGLGERDEALQILRVVERIEERVLGPNHESTQLTKNKIKDICKMLGRQE